MSGRAGGSLSPERGANIATLRRQASWSQDDLAKLLDVQQSTISRWEHDGAPVLALLAVERLYTLRHTRPGFKPPRAAARKRVPGGEATPLPR